MYMYGKERFSQIYLPVNKSIVYLRKQCAEEERTFDCFFKYSIILTVNKKKINDKWNIYCRNEVYFTLLFPNDT